MNRISMPPSKIDIVIQASERRAKAFENMHRVKSEADSARKVLDTKLEALTLAGQELASADAMLLDACKEAAK